MMTIAMLLGLLNMAWEKATGKSQGVHFFLPYDDDHDDLRFVEYCLENTAGNSKGVHLFQQDYDDYGALMTV